MTFANMCTGIMIPKKMASHTTPRITVSFMAYHNTMYYLSTKGTYQ